MERELIIRMAREAGIIHAHDTDGQWDGITDQQLLGYPYANPRSQEWAEKRIVEILEPFAALVAAHAKQEYIDSVYEQHRETMFSNKDLGMLVDAVKAEREACARVCEDMGNTEANMNKTWRNGCSDAAAAIRARSEK